MIVSEFLYIPWKFMKEQVATQATIRDDISCTPSITVMAAENLERQAIEHLCDKVWTFTHYRLILTTMNILPLFCIKQMMMSIYIVFKVPESY